MKPIYVLLVALAATLPFGAPAEPAEATPTASDTWAAIKDDTYQQRLEFTSGARRLLDHVDDQIRRLNERRATVPETSIQDWDTAMKALVEERTSLQAMISTLADATSQTWSQAKERVGTAWQRTQDACDKVKLTSTS